MDQNQKNRRGLAQTSATEEESLNLIISQLHIVYAVHGIELEYLAGQITATCPLCFPLQVQPLTIASMQYTKFSSIIGLHGIKYKQEPFYSCQSLVATRNIKPHHF